MSIYPDFETNLSLELIKAILIEHLGVWDAIIEPQKESKEFQEYNMYRWHYRGISFILGEGKRKHYYEYSGFRGRRIAKTIVKRVTGKDKVWTLRKLLSSATDPNRLKRHDVKAYIPFAVVGVALAFASLLMSLMNLDVGIPFALIAAVLTPLLYGLHRYGVSEDAVDLRIFAIGLQWTIVLFGLPFSMLLLAIAIYLPSTMNPILVFVILFTLYFVIRAVFLRILHFPEQLNKELRKIWSEIRKKGIDDEQILKPDDKPSIGYRLGEVALMKFLSPFGVAYTMGLTGVFYGITKSLGLIREFESVFYLTLFLVILIALGVISIDMGFTMGISHVQKEFLDSTIMTVNSNGVVEILPTAIWASSVPFVIFVGDSEDSLDSDQKESKE